MMEIKAIRTEADYLEALQELSVLIDLDPAADQPEGERLEILGTLVQAYEAKNYSIDSQTFVDTSALTPQP
jgi:HTH-type transcriptional regulator/antitoxin HigA